MPVILDPTVLVRKAHEMLARFVDPATLAQRTEMTRALAPLDGDFARVFVPDAVDAAREGYATLWQSNPEIVARPGQIHVLVHMVVGGEFLLKTPGTQQFPGGYEQIAKQLLPDVPWFSWKFVIPGERSGMAYDGLVSLDDRFLWLPKPWKVLTKGTSPMSHYAN